MQFVAQKWDNAFGLPIGVSEPEESLQFSSSIEQRSTKRSSGEPAVLTAVEHQNNGRQNGSKSTW